MADNKEFKSVLDENKKQTAILNQLAVNDQRQTEAAEKQAEIAENTEKKTDEVKKGIVAGFKNFIATVNAEAAEREAMAAKETEEKRENPLSKLVDKFQELKDGILGGLNDFMKSSAFGGKLTVGDMLLGAGLAALLAFMQSPYWEKTISLLEEYLAPALEWLYDAVGGFGMALMGLAVLFRGPIIKAVKGLIKLGTFVKNVFMSSYLAGFREWFMEKLNLAKGKLLKGLKWLKALAITAKTKMMTEYIPTMIDHFKSMMKNLGGKFMTLIRSVGTAAKAFKVFMLTAFIPGMISFFTGMWTSLTAILAPLAPFILIGAAIAAVAYAMYESFKKAFEVFEETGSIGDAIAAFFASMITAPLRWAKSLLSTVLEWLGFDEAAAYLDSIDIFEPVFGFFKGIVDWVKLLFSDPTQALSNLWNGIMSGFDGLMGLLFSPINSAINWVMEAFGWKTEGEEDFDLWEYIKGVAGSVWQWLKDTFSFDWPDFDIAGGMRDMMRNLLPNVDSWAAKLIPDSVYRAYGINPETGESLEPIAGEDGYEDEEYGDASYLAAPPPPPDANMRGGFEGTGEFGDTDALESGSREMNQQTPTVIVMPQPAPQASGGRNGSPRTRIVPIHMRDQDSATAAMVECSY